MKMELPLKIHDGDKLLRHIVYIGADGRAVASVVGSDVRIPAEFFAELVRLANASAALVDSVKAFQAWLAHDSKGPAYPRARSDGTMNDRTAIQWLHPSQTTTMSVAEFNTAMAAWGDMYFHNGEAYRLVGEKIAPDVMKVRAENIMDARERKAEAKKQAARFIGPAATYKPRVFMDGNKWCALYGDNIQEGVAAFGDTPQQAMDAFDRVWTTEVAK